MQSGAVNVELIREATIENWKQFRPSRSPATAHDYVNQERPSATINFLTAAGIIRDVATRFTEQSRAHLKSAQCCRCPCAGSTHFNKKKKTAIYRACVLPWNLPSIRSQQRSIFSLSGVKRSQRKRKSAIKSPKEEMKRRTEHTRKREKECSPRLTCKAAKKKTRRSKSPDELKKEKKYAKAWNVQECAARRARIWPSWALSWAHTKTSHKNRFTVWNIFYTILSSLFFLRCAPKK